MTCAPRLLQIALIVLLSCCRIGLAEEHKVPATNPAGAATTRASGIEIYRAARLRRIHVLAKLLDEGFDVNGRNGYGETAVSAASQRGYVDVLTLLFSHHADASLAAYCGQTPLMVAKTEAVASILLDHQADLEAKDRIFGWTALSFSICDNRIDVVKLLLARHANVNCVDKDGLTPMQLAIKMERHEIVGLLEANRDKE